MEGTTPETNQPAQPEQPTGRVFDQKDRDENKYVAALSYLGILFLVPMLVKQDSSFAQFHARQGLVLTIAFFIGSFVFWIPIIGWLALLFMLIVDIMALIRTLSGEAWEIPVVKDIVKKLNI